MNVLYVSAEVAPYVAVGGLSQVSYFLPRSLNRLGHDVRIFTPKYGLMDAAETRKKPWKLVMEYEGLAVSLEHNKELTKGSTSLICNVKSYHNKKFGLSAYFLENQEYYELRANVFGYVDDHIRFALLAKGCLEWLLKEKKLHGWLPDIIHCHDWHTGYFIDLARRNKRYAELLHRTPIVYTVHNFQFQGNYDFRYAPPEERDDGSSPLAPITSPQFQKQNALLRGLLYADAVNTVSPTHAVEVFTHEYAEGLDDTLPKIRGKLVGILNGLDTHEFNPSTDTIIKRNFNEQTFVHARKENKRDLQRLFLLPVEPAKPLLAFCGRLTPQKGLELLHAVLPKLLAERPDVQMVILGSGDERYKRDLQRLQKDFPKQLGTHLHTDFRLPRSVFAGADMMLVPSIFEPGGIVGLEALRYGCVPIVRRTGGLNDIVQDFDLKTFRGNGFSFHNKNAWSFYAAIIEALTVYKNPSIWKKLTKNCLLANFSWAHTAKEYERWYRRVLEERKRAISATPHPAYTFAASAN